MRFFILLFMCFVFLEINAQNCSGDISAPVFLENFGSGSGEGPALPPGTTSYNYGSIGNGNYVVTNTSGLNGGLWHTEPDHTPDDTDGYMLLFDASGIAGTFFQTTFIDLCPNTDYVFSCFAANIVVPSACGGSSVEPNLRFSVVDPVTNAELGFTTSGNIPTTDELEWNAYDIVFRTNPGQTTLRLVVTNNSPGGCGNDLVLDDFSLSYCNPSTEQQFDICDLPEGLIEVGTNTYIMAGTYVDVIPLPNNSCNDSTVTTTLTGMTTFLPDQNFTFCAGDTLVLPDGRVFTDSQMLTDTIIDISLDCPRYQNTIITAQAPQLTEQEVILCNGDALSVGNNVYQEAGIYQDMLQSNAGCDSLVISTVSLSSVSVSLPSQEFELSIGDELLLEPTVISVNELVYCWSPPEAFSCFDCPKPNFVGVTDGDFSLLVKDTLTACADSVTFAVNFLPCAEVYIPNIFSPNNDGLNDYFTAFAENCFAQIKIMRIFDRWGSLLYEGADLPLNNPNAGWNGSINSTTAQPGVYVYEIILEVLNGETVVKKGDITLIR